MSKTNLLNRTHKQHYHRKMHLSGLPEITSFPKWKGNKNDIALVIPLFSFTDEADAVAEYLAKASAWSLWTWVTYSDLAEYDATCLIYVESNIADVALPILKAYNVPEHFIKVADFDRTHWLGKCLQPIFDKDFREVKYLCISDSDLFVAPGPKKEILPICKNLTHAAPTGFGCKIQHCPIPGYWIPHLRQCFEYINKTPFDKGVNVDEVWLEAFKAISGTDVSRYWGQQADNTPWTGLMVIPKNTFSNEDKSFLEKASRILADDEAVMYAWSKYKNGNRMWDIGEIHIDLMFSIMHYMETAYLRNRSMVNKGWMHFDDTFIQEPCLIHHFCSLEHKFQQVIGAK